MSIVKQYKKYESYCKSKGFSLSCMDVMHLDKMLKRFPREQHRRVMFEYANRRSAILHEKPDSLSWASHAMRVTNLWLLDLQPSSTFIDRPVRN